MVVMLFQMTTTMLSVVCYTKIMNWFCYCCNFFAILWTQIYWLINIEYIQKTKNDINISQFYTDQKLTNLRF